MRGRSARWKEHCRYSNYWKEVELARGTRLGLLSPCARVLNKRVPRDTQTRLGMVTAHLYICIYKARIQCIDG